MYSVKPFIVIVILQTFLRVNCQCTESRRAARNYGQILPAGVAQGVDGRENELSSTLKPETNRKEHDEEMENRSTTGTFKTKDFAQKRTDNDDEEESFRREKDRWNNSEKDKEDGNINVFTNAPDISPNSPYFKKVLLNAREFEKPIESRDNRQNSSEKYKRKENDTIVYNGYIVAPKINISRKTVEIEKEKHQQNRVNGQQISNLERNKKESANYNRPLFTMRNVNHTHRTEVANEEIGLRSKENEHWRSDQTTNVNRPDQKQKSSKRKVQKNKHGRRHKEEEEEEEEEDENV